MMTPHMSKKPRKQLHWRSWLLFLFGAFFFITVLISPGTKHKFDNESVKDFSTGWELVDAEGVRIPGQGELTLPVKLNTKGIVRIAKTIPEGVGYPAVLGFRTAHQKLRLSCEGELLYSFGYETEPAFGKSPGNAFHTVRLPVDAPGKRLVLEFNSPYSTYEGRIEEFVVGSKAALMFWLMRKHGFSLVITLIIFVISMVTLIIDFLIIRKDAAVGMETFYLGLFSLFISLWLFGEGRMVQFFGIPPAVNTCFVFLCMLSTPIPLINYVACGCTPPRKRLMLYVVRMLSGVFVASIMLQVLGILDFIEQLLYIHIFFGIACAALLYAVVYDYVKSRDSAHLRLLISMGILALFFVLETVGIYYGANNVGDMMRIGVLAFILIQVQSAFKNAVRMMQMGRLAGIDALTGCLNRTAYSQKLAELDGKSAVGVVIVDINNLKIINDTHGHEIGDDAIIRCGKCMMEAFSSCGSCFRIGGDEFVMLGKNISAERLTEVIATFDRIQLQESQQANYPFGVSYGFTIYDPRKDKSLAEAISKADKVMYINKRKLKGQE